MSAPTTAPPGSGPLPPARSGPVARGLRDMAPLALAVIPFGIAVGVAAATAGLSLGQNLFGALIMLAGAGQLAAVEAIGQGHGLPAVLTVVLLVNLRFVFYGAGIATWFADLPLRRRLLLAYPVVDQTFMLGQQHFTDRTDLRWRQRYYLAGTVLLASAFVLSQVLALPLGSVLPAGSGMHLAAPLVFAGMLAQAPRTRAVRLVVPVAAGVTVALSGLLSVATLPLAVLLAVGVAHLARTRTETRTGTRTVNRTEPSPGETS